MKREWFSAVTALATASAWETSLRASPCTLVRASPRSPAPARLWCRAPTSWLDISVEDRGSRRLAGVPREERLYAIVAA